MIISKELRKSNIAGYLLYMWQIEDLLRANELSIEKIEERVISPYNLSEEQKTEMREWYENLIAMMRDEGVVEKGHLQINKNVLIMLVDLHQRLLKSPKVPFYSTAYFKVLPYVVEFRSKSDGKDKGEIENCFDAMYMVWLMKLQKREINEQTLNATAEISRFIDILSKYYRDETEGKLDLESDEE